MPLRKSSSVKALRQNIRTLIHEGKPTKQAAAIAYDIQRKSKKKRR